ncbi:MAG: DUF6516 family protein [Cyanobacteria bacterium]|nr:DUF6516 family protein [Cyanobacteriota bacterium]
MDAEQYLSEIKTKLIISPAILSFTVVEEQDLSDRGYFRARVILANNDFLEVSEYFIVDSNKTMPQRYRYQWMDDTQSNLRRRWDNVPHFPNLPNFPYHIHIASEGNVEPSQALGILEVLQIIEKEIAEN